MSKRLPTPKFNTPDPEDRNPQVILGWWITLTAPVVAVVLHDTGAMTLQLAAGLALLGLPLPGGDRPAT
ncbi:hypothetical protein [Kineococcus radiotolerans]|nr:hypothetical protein [Kineococcus radiotolerans]